MDYCDVLCRDRGEQGVCNEFCHTGLKSKIAQLCTENEILNAVIDKLIEDKDYAIREQYKDEGLPFDLATKEHYIQIVKNERNKKKRCVDCTVTVHRQNCENCSNNPEENLNTDTGNYAE